MDGSGFSRWPDQRISLAGRWLADLHGRDAGDRPVGHAARRFFAGPRGLVAGPGWRVAGVELVNGRFVIDVESTADPLACPRCGAATARSPARPGTRAVAVRVRRRWLRAAAAGPHGPTEVLTATA